MIRLANIGAERAGICTSFGPRGDGAAFGEARPDALSSVAPDLLPLVEAYEANLREDGFTDWAGLLTIATDAVMNEGFTHRLMGLPAILLDVPMTSEAELDFFRAVHDFMILDRND